MHILMLTPAYPPFPGGGERYVRSLALGLLAEGHEITAVTSQARTEKAFWNGSNSHQLISEQVERIEIIRCPIRPFPGSRRGLMAWRKLMVLVSMLPGQQTAVLQHLAQRIPPITGIDQAFAQVSKNIDIVHGFNISWEYPMLTGWQWARANHIPYVATPFAHLGTGDDRVALNSTMDHQLALLSDADRVLVLTSIEKKELAMRGVPSSQVDVIHGGLDPLPALPDPAVTQEKYQLPQPFVIFVGRASYDKGAVQAAEAVLSLRQGGTAVTLVLVGQSSPEFDRFYTQLAAQEKEWIRPLGIVSEVEKHSLLAAAEILLLPSRTDSFGIVLLEAWAHGKPVIAARAGGIPGVVDDGENGLLVPFGDVPKLAEAVETLLTNKALSQKMGRLGQEKIKTVYDWQQVTRKVLAAYQTLQKNKEPI